VAALLKIGGIGFGDGMAVTALKEDESLRQHRLVSMTSWRIGVGLRRFWIRAANVSVFLGFVASAGSLARRSASSFRCPICTPVTGGFRRYKEPLLDWTRM